MFPVNLRTTETVPDLPAAPQLAKLITVETQDQAALPVVGGDLALDFANTVNDPLGPDRHDYLPTYADLIEWARVHDVLNPVDVRALVRRAARYPEEAALALEHAHELRDAINDVFGSVVQGAEVATRWPSLRPFLRDATATAELTGPPYHWSWADSTHLDRVLHPVAVAAADLLVSNNLQQIKQCARCPWLFLDASKNHTRRWCDMNACGRAQKIERYLAKRATRRTHSSR